MKHLVELTNITEAGLPQIYCDMDMVLCDFIGGYEKLTGKDFAKTDIKMSVGKKLRQRKISGQH